MGLAHINLEDDPDGKGVHVQEFYQDGFQVESQAHQIANLLIKHLKTLGTQIGEAEVAMVKRRIEKPLVIRPDDPSNN